MTKKRLSLFQPIDLTEGTCWKTIFLFSIPIIISYLLQQIYTISDAAIVGQTLAADEVAGVNDTSPIAFIFLQFAFGVSAGFCAVTARSVGAHDEAAVRRSLATQIVLSAALTVALTALALVLLNPMLAWINLTPASGEVYRAAFTYCAIIFAGIGAQLFYNFICSFLRSLGDSVTPLLFLLFSTALNVGLDLLFIVTFHWGVAGAAIATVLAQLLSTIGCFCYAFARYPKLRLHRQDWAITRHDIGQHAFQGIPLGLQFSVLAIGIIVVQSVVVKFDILDGQMVSNAAQNGFGAANKFTGSLMTLLNGLGTAMTSFVAQNLGAGNFERIRKGARQALVMFAIATAISAALGFLFTIGNFYLHLFLSADKVTADTIRFGNGYMRVDMSLMLFLGGVFLLRNCVQGIGKPQLSSSAAVSPSWLRVCWSACCCRRRSRAVRSARALCLADPMAWFAADPCRWSFRLSGIRYGLPLPCKRRA
ncbi:MAG: MATE family efflux transporter [Oscillospiraceae bacterium]